MQQVLAKQGTDHVRQAGVREDVVARIGVATVKNDHDIVLTRIGGTVPTHTVHGYLPEDTDLDGSVKYTGTGNDRDPILQSIGGTVTTNVLFEQLP